jgi:flagellar hook-associated protein 2
MGFSVGGLISGLDTEKVISQMLEIERQPIIKLQTKEAGYQVKLTSYGSLKSTLATLKNAASSLDTSTDLNQFSAASSDASVFTASVFSTAKTGTYSLSVQSLAEAHKVKSNAFAVDEAIGEGKFTIQLGSGNSAEITTDADDTLEDVARLINEKQKDVQAAVITNGDHAYLTLTGLKTGAANTIRIEISEENPPVPVGDDPEYPEYLSDQVGLSRLLYVQGGTHNHLDQTQAASDAILSVDGVEGIHRPTNTIADVIKGVTLNIKDVTAVGETESLTITRDTAALTSKMNAFIEAYNAVVDFFKEVQKYDSRTQEAGALLGDSTANQIRNRLRGIVANSVAGVPGGLSRLSDLGVTMATDGKLELDTTVLNEVLTDKFDEVLSFFTAADGEQKGFGVRLVSTLDTMLNSTKGDLATKTAGIQSSIDRIDSDIAKYEARALKVEERLRAQFESLELILAKYQKTGDYLTQQIEALQGMYKS